MEIQGDHAQRSAPLAPESPSDAVLHDTPSHRADQMLGKRWIVPIVRALLEHGPCRFSELATRVGRLSDRMLSTRLGELEACGIVERRVDAEAKPVRIVYTLTPKGAALRPVVQAIVYWSDHWLGD